MEKTLPKGDGMQIRKMTEEVVKVHGDPGRIKMKMVVGKNGTVERKPVRDYAKGA